MKATDVMVSNVITVDVDASIGEVAATLLNNHISGAPVVGKNGELVGIVSEGDLSRIGAMSGRVNMSKFLLTVCAFGLLLSSAFAEEKSREQYREERSHIFGIEGQENQTFTRFAASGAKQRIGFYASLNPDCTASGDVNVRVTKQPEHGTVDTVATTDYVHYPKENIRSKCNQHKVKGTLVNYKAAEKYTGKDEFDLLILYPSGLAREDHFDISVR